MKRRLKEIRLLYIRKALELLREPIWILTGLSTPILYLALFAPLLKSMSPSLGTDNVFNIFVPGMLALFAFSSGIGEGWTVVWELRTGVIERLRVTPVSRFALLMGPILRDISLFLASSLIVIVVSTFFGFTVNILGLIILMLLLCMLTAIITATSISMALIFKSSGTLAAVMSGVQLPITLLAGVLIPLSVGPKWLQVMAHFNPLYYVVEASRALAVGNISDSSVITAFCVITPLMFFVLSWATYTYRKTVA